MKFIKIIILSLLITSCIPVRIAPKIKTDKVMKGKRFKRVLPKDYAFIFQDPKDANEFYDYINVKFQKNNTNAVLDNTFSVNDKMYYLSFYEVDKPVETLNLLPIVVDAKLNQSGVSPILQDAYTSRKDCWYVALTVADIEAKDALHPNYSERETVVKYLQDLRTEYLTTHNYYEVLFKKDN